MTTPLFERYSHLRKKYRVVKRTWQEYQDNRIAPDAGPESLDAKSPALHELYPNIAEYRVVSTDRFYDKGIAQLEWDKLWNRVWLLAGLAADVKAVGDWLTFQIGPHDIVVVRSAPDEVKAFYNVCRHRGNKIVHGDFGTGYKCFECSFHGWLWKLDGSLMRATDRDSFAPEALAAVNGEGLDMKSVHAEVYAGLVFISFDAEPVPLKTYLSGMGPILESYELETMTVIRDVQLEMPANWKLALNAFTEAYHVHSQHPQATLRGDDVDVQFDFYENGHNRMIQPQGLVSGRRTDNQEMHQPLADMILDAGLNPDDFIGRNGDARLAIREVKRKPDNIFNMDYSRMTDSQVTDIWAGQVFPNVTFTTQAEAFSFQRFLPHPTDPEKTIWNVIQVGRKTKSPRRLEIDPAVFEGPRLARKRTSIDNTGLYEVLDQDVETIPNVQKGVRSPSMKFVRFGEQEARLQQMYAEIDKYLYGN
jgi:phenylpropionate dioxygenase-like ring-hydroxylating dioxygenase large terminal subunit